MNDRLVIKRVWNHVCMVIVTIMVTLLLCAKRQILLDQFLGIVCIAVIWFVLFLFLIEHDRAEGLICHNRETDFRKILYGYTSAAIVVFLAAYFPEFVKPLMLVPLLIVAFGSERLALITGIFWDAMLCLVLGLHSQELVLYCLMTIFGAILAGTAEEAVKHEKTLIWYEVLLFCLSIMLPITFYYLTYQEVHFKLLLWGLFEGAISVLWMQFGFRHFSRLREQEVNDILTDIIDDTYPLVRELSSFSKQEYQHARRVSELAAKCAKVAGADEKTCAAAGFYYRIGIMEGEPLTQSGIRIVQEHCFPEDVIRIISEYDGETAPPSSIESAIVHMVNGLVKKIEVFDSYTMASEWNQDMVIYQTLNEYSASGIYDQSGLGMNMFLKIREYLVNEENFFF